LGGGLPDGCFNGSDTSEAAACDLSFTYQQVVYSCAVKLKRKLFYGGIAAVFTSSSICRTVCSNAAASTPGA